MSRFLLTPALLAITSAAAFAAPPAWWATRGATNSAPADNNAPVNQGQLKHFTFKAVEELNDAAPGGAGTELTQLVQQWIDGSPDTDDSVALNVGQLKWVANKIHGRLVQLRWESARPAWIAPAATDYNLATIGQLKTVFNFDLAPTIPGQLPEWWQMYHFDGVTGIDPEEDSDNDGFDNKTELQAGTNPNNAADFPPQLHIAKRLAFEQFHSVTPPGSIASGCGFWQEWGGSQSPVTKLLPTAPLYHDDIATELAAAMPYPAVRPAGALKRGQLTPGAFYLGTSDFTEVYETSSALHVFSDYFQTRCWLRNPINRGYPTAFLAVSEHQLSGALYDVALFGGVHNYWLDGSPPNSVVYNVASVNFDFAKDSEFSDYVDLELPLYDGGAGTTAVCKHNLVSVLLKDIKDHANSQDDQVVANWNPSKDITKSNIAWIEAHTSDTNSAPRMPQLELSIPGLELDGVTIEAKLEVKYDRGNGNRSSLNQPEDTVNIPAGGGFTQIAGKSWKIYNDAAWKNELTAHGFFGGKATITYKLMKGVDEVMAPQTILFRIGGKNPEPARAKQFIETIPGTGPQDPLWFSYAIAKSETADRNNNGTRYNHFWHLSPDVTDNYHEERVASAGLVVWGREPGPGGYGLFQITGDITDEEANIPRSYIWNWQENARAGVPFLDAKRKESDVFMNRQRNSNNANGVPLPSLTVRGVTFAEGAVRSMNSAEAIKHYNGSSQTRLGFTDPGPTPPGFVLDGRSGDYFCYWKNSTSVWALNRYNTPKDPNITPFNYVDRVCAEVE